MATSEEIFDDAMALPPHARAALTERSVESLAQDLSAEITSKQLVEYGEELRRLSQAKSN